MNAYRHAANRIHRSGSHYPSCEKIPIISEVFGWQPVVATGLAFHVLPDVLVKRRGAAASGGGPQARNELKRFVIYGVTHVLNV